MKETNGKAVDKLLNKAKRIRGLMALKYGFGKLDEALEFIKQGEDLIENFQGELPTELEEIHLYHLRFKTTISAYRGELALNFKHTNTLLTVAKKYNNKWGLSEAVYALGRYYWLCGDTDKALVHLDRALMHKANLINDISPPMTADMGMTATQIAVEIGDLKRANKYFKQVEEIYNHFPGKSGLMVQAYQLAKANILKSSMRARDRIKAEDLFKEVMESNDAIDIYKFKALFGLSELLIVELRITNDVNIINEITPLINKLIDVAQQQQYNYYLLEAYVLQSKLSLLIFDVKTARRFLTQAKRIAERHGYNGVATEISYILDELMERLGEWKYLKETNAPLSERIELARLNDHLKGKFRTKMMKMERIVEKEITIYKDLKTCIVCKGDAEGFDVFICPNCNSIYCKGCAEALIAIENECWTCNIPIDNSKPIKSLKLEEPRTFIKIKKKK